ncbi:ArsR family transcriptional regulator [Amylibacter marinus]|uniref:ArsR family transcriptional regulator n=1 Tax=Amylibacter marinus TaxID=1475483 RepID=A0ABQ5VU66_9RHOB|nr:Lrp/AsnC family transcriptional regulator [Amylibacter marinus]GLQ34701.1 ArsR family transcriptional regulator [Amylibacter marinus]
MSVKLDDIDLGILRLLQKDANLSIDTISERVALSRNACWRRIKQYEEVGLIQQRVALLDADQLNLSLVVMVMIRAASHGKEWMDQFHRVICHMPEVVGAYRMTGDLDYILRVRVSDIAAYDRFYKTLTERIEIGDVSASFVMEELKEGTELPI